MTKKYTIAYAKEAYEDLKAIYAYIAEKLVEPAIAAKQVDRIRIAVRGLESMPNRCAVVPWEPWVSMGIRKLIVDNYIVFYLVDEVAQRVSVIRIAYRGRDMESVLGEQTQEDG